MTALPGVPSIYLPAEMLTSGRMRRPTTSPPNIVSIGCSQLAELQSPKGCHRMNCLRYFGVDVSVHLGGVAQLVEQGTFNPPRYPDCRAPWERRRAQATT